MKLHWQILLSLACAVPAGLLTPQLTAVSGVDVIAIYQFFGSLFLNALKMIIVPLIISSIIVGVGSINQDGSFARMGGKTFLYYVCTSAIAIVIGLVTVSYTHLTLPTNTTV